MSIVLYDEFTLANPFTLEKLNNNFRIMAAQINALAGQTLVQPSVVPGNTGESLPITGGDLLGQLGAPSILVGPAAGPRFEVVTEGDIATTVEAGIVKQALSVLDLDQVITPPPTQDEVQDISDKVDELLGKLRTAGIVKP